jgi:hypothetical protein
LTEKKSGWKEKVMIYRVGRGAAMSFFLFFTICLFMAAGPEVRADGKFFAEEAVAVPPEMPSQRAFLSFREGEETLLIESTLRGGGQRFGWLIPLPAEPTEMAAAPPGLLETLSLTLRPTVVHDRGSQLGAQAFAAVLVTALCCVFLFVPAEGRQRRAVLLALVLLLLIFGALLTPGLMGERPMDVESAKGVELHQRRRIGDYDVAVLSAAAAERLSDWLTANGFTPLPPEAHGVAQRYLDEGWVFVAAQLAREAANGTSTPRPVRLTFPASEPVYPLRLTGVGSEGLYLELYVAAQTRLAAAPLATDLADTVTLQTHPAADGAPPYLEARSRVLELSAAHPALEGLLWNGCWLTRLSGALTPAQMAADLRLAPAERQEAGRRLLYSPQGARHTVLIITLLAWLLALPLLTLRHRWGRTETAPKAAAREVLLPAAAAALACALAFGSLLPVTETRTLLRPPGYFFSFLRTHVMHVAETETPLLRVLDKNSAEAHLIEKLAAANLVNPFTGEPLQAHPAPGNVGLRRGPEGLYVLFYGRDGRPQAHLLSPRDAPGGAAADAASRSADRGEGGDSE